MARKAARSKARRSAPATPPPADTPRAKIIEAFMALLAEQPIEKIGLAVLAERAGISLAELRGEFSSTMAVLAAHVKDLDRQVLAGGDADMNEEDARERLFDVLMRRLEMLAPHKEAVRSLMRSARRNPPLPRFLYALGIRHVGETTAIALARGYGSWKDFHAAALKVVDKDEEAVAEMDALDQIGEIGISARRRRLRARGGSEHKSRRDDGGQHPP